ncbi:MAG: hypothetical protein A2017_22215 [Lentisphaerae bacterium GWF2_44_16]|nr:MAG: hypothetical protein A2017_22215 [Lentisphaerae bacterium GWF2_44_16]
MKQECIKGFFCTLRLGPSDADVINRIIDAAAKAGLNTLCIELEKGMNYDSHPEISAPWALEKNTIKDLVEYSKNRNIDIIPLIPLFSHVNYITDTHPEFLEPASKVYCTSAPGLYDFVFELMDEVIDIFKPRYFHIGHDEALTSYDPRSRTPLLRCPSCKNKKAYKVFAEDIKKLHAYLSRRNIRTMMWADGLLDTENFSEASFCQSGCYGGKPDYLSRAIDLLPRDIILCDWHYEPAKEFPTTLYLQKKGFETLGAPNFEVNSFLFTNYAHAKRTEKLKGMLATSWCHLNKHNFRYLKNLITQHGFFFNNPGRIPEKNRVLKKIKGMKNIIQEGSFRKIYDFKIDGEGIYNSSGWRDLRFMEWPVSADPMTPPRYPSSLEIKALRHGYIDYDFDAGKDKLFESVSIKVWMKCPGKSFIIFRTAASSENTVISENTSLSGSKIDLSELAGGKRKFHLRFEAENKSDKKTSFLRRFELEGKIKQGGNKC